MKKRLMGRCTWKCIALIFIFLTILLSTLLVYFLGEWYGSWAKYAPLKF